MLKEQSNPLARLKYLYVLPLTAIAITAFARPEVSNELKEISAFKVGAFMPDAVINEMRNQDIPQQGDSMNNPLFLLDGKEVSAEIMGAIDRNKIEAVEFLSG
jgi:hypothetical protein